MVATAHVHMNTATTSEDIHPVSINKPLPGQKAPKPSESVQEFLGILNGIAKEIGIEPTGTQSDKEKTTQIITVNGNEALMPSNYDTYQYLNQGENNMPQNRATSEEDQNLWEELLKTGVEVAGTYAANSAIQKQNQNYNSKEAQKQRNFEKEMSSTAYQRAYSDMLTAGLNPNLAGGAGGANTPAGANAASTNAPYMEYGAMANILNNTALTSAQIDNMTADSRLKMKQTGKSQKEIETMDIQNGIAQTMSVLDAQLKITTNEKERNEIMKAQKELDKIKNETDLIKAQKEIAEWEARHPVITKLLPGASGIAGGVVGMAVGGPAGAMASSMVMGKSRPIGFRP